VKKSELFSYRVEEVREHSSPEFDALNPLQKGRALAAFAMNAKTLAKVPGYIKEALVKFKN